MPYYFQLKDIFYWLVGLIPFMFSPPQTTQLYYDNNTGIYYSYDANTGRYQYHSRIEVLPAAQIPEEPSQTTGEKKGRKLKKGSKKTLNRDDEVCNFSCCMTWIHG